MDPFLVKVICCPVSQPLSPCLDQKQTLHHHRSQDLAYKKHPEKPNISAQKWVKVFIPVGWILTSGKGGIRGDMEINYLFIWPPMMIYSEIVPVCKDTQRIPACWSSTETPHSRHQAAASTRMCLTRLLIFPLLPSLFSHSCSSGFMLAPSNKALPLASLPLTLFPRKLHFWQ